MFQARLQRRLRELDLLSFDEYASTLLKNQAESAEFNLLADYISTNKTEFFREKEHFQFLSETVIPELLKKGSDYEISPMKIWSAGCSSGQEAYSIAITLEEFIHQKPVRFHYSILATDISVRMLKMANEAIYPMSQVEVLPLSQKHKYFLKSKNPNDQKVRVIKDIRDKVRVAYLNLMDSSYPQNMLADVVFLRNTLIYFSHDIQLKVLSKVMNNLKTGGYLFIGHSESLINMNLPILSIAPSVYVKTNTVRL